MSSLLLGACGGGTGDERASTSIDHHPATAVSEIGPCEPDVTFGDGGDYDPSRGARLHDAFNATPDDGTLGVLPGNYDLPTKDLGFIWARLNGKSKRICGTAGKPTIRTPQGATWSFGDFDKLTIDNIAVDQISVSMSGSGGGVVFNHLRLDNVDLSGAPNECLFVSYGPQLDPNERPGKFGDDPTTTSYITMTNSSMTDCASPNYSDHTMYLSRRGCVMRADNVRIEHLGGLDGFRSLCRVNIVTNSFFTNVIRESDGTLRARPNGLRHGGTPMDFPSCGAYVLRGNRFEVQGSGTTAAVGIRSRISMTACDMPNWSEPGDGGKFWKGSFWSAVREKPVTSIDNPHIFPVIAVNNEFDYIHQGGTNNSRVFSGWGTYPRRHTDSGTNSALLDWLDVPDADDSGYQSDNSWIERNVVFSSNNSFTGEWADIHNLNLVQAVADTSDSDILHPPPPVRFRDIADPDELPQTCAALEAKLTGWWDEPGDHDGFPDCPR